jgi:hypothetical protein
MTMMAQHSPAPLKALRFLCLVCQYFPIQTEYICKQIHENAPLTDLKWNKEKHFSIYATFVFQKSCQVEIQ